MAQVVSLLAVVQVFEIAGSNLSREQKLFFRKRRDGRLVSG